MWLVTVKDLLEAKHVVREAVGQAVEVGQGAEAQDVLPGTVREPRHCWIGQLLLGHAPRQQVAPLRLGAEVIRGQRCPCVGTNYFGQITLVKHTALGNTHITSHSKEYSTQT